MISKYKQLFLRFREEVFSLLTVRQRIFEPGQSEAAHQLRVRQREDVFLRFLPVQFLPKVHAQKTYVPQTQRRTVVNMMGLFRNGIEKYLIII